MVQAWYTAIIPYAKPKLTLDKLLGREEKKQDLGQGLHGALMAHNERLQKKKG